MRNNKFIIDYKGAISTILSSQHVLVCRPTCSGKSMLLSTFNNYFNVDREPFETCESSSTDFPEHDDSPQHPYRASFHVITLHLLSECDRSSKTSNPYGDSLNFSLHSLVNRGRLSTGSKVELHPTCGFTSLRTFAMAIKESATPRLMILIDDYDKFINFSMNSSSDYDKHVLSQTSSLRVLLAAIKSLETVGLQQYHTVMTGITPLPLHDLGEAATHVQNLTAHPSLSGALGLTEETTVRALVEIGQHNNEAHQSVLNVMRSLFGTHQFCLDSGSMRVFNTLEALRFLCRCVCLFCFLLFIILSLFRKCRSRCTGAGQWRGQSRLIPKTIGEKWARQLRRAAAAGRTRPCAIWRWQRT